MQVVRLADRGAISLERLKRGSFGLTILVNASRSVGFVSSQLRDGSLSQQTVPDQHVQ